VKVDMTSRQARSSTPAEWAAAHQTYWDSIAERYDRFYDSSWSRRENRRVTSQLRKLPLSQRPVVLDLGCGTGLGATIIRDVRPEATYVGVDLSSAMLDQARLQHPGAAFLAGDFDEGFTHVGDESTDLVLALFSTLSFSENPTELLNSVQRVLKPGGIAYLSALGSSSVSSRRNHASTYATRGDRRRGVIPVNRFTAAQLYASARAAGFSEARVSGINAFSGVAESSILWWPGLLLARIRPDLSHLLELTVSKAEHGARR